jgi:hypothetical protein
MWLSGAPKRYTMRIKGDDIQFVENHKIDPLAPIEVDVPDPVGEKKNRLYSVVWAVLRYLEFTRNWRNEHKLILETEAANLEL